MVLRRGYSNLGQYSVILRASFARRISRECTGLVAAKGLFGEDSRAKSQDDASGPEIFGRSFANSDSG